MHTLFSQCLQGVEHFFPNLLLFRTQRSRKPGQLQGPFLVLAFEEEYMRMNLFGFVWRLRSCGNRETAAKNYPNARLW